MQDRILTQVPELRDLLPSLSSHISRFQGFSLQGAANVVAVPLVVTQAINDFVDGLTDCTCGRGRQALRATRSLFETTITFQDIVADESLRERYMAYREVIDARSVVHEASLAEIGLRSWVKRRVFRARYSKRCDSIELAMKKKYGKSFLRGWHPDDMRTRAQRHALGEEYRFYQLSSAILHGSAAGYLGLTADIKGSTIHRIGPALTLTTVAFPQLTRYFLLLLRTHARAYKPGVVVDDLVGIVSELNSVIPVFRRKILRLDRTIWPDNPAPGPLCVVVVSGIDARPVWYIHDLQAGVIREASPPRNRPRALGEMIEQMQLQVSANPAMGPLSCVYFSGDCQPLPNTDWVPDSGVLGPPYQ